MNAPTQPEPNRRVLRALRTHLIVTSVMVTSSFAAVMALAIFAPLAAQMKHVRLDSDAAIGLAEHFLFLHSAFWPVVLGSLLACIASGTILYQRMRAPLIRFVKCFESIKAGAIPRPIVIRSADYLSEESDALNSMIASLDERASRSRRAATRIDEILGELLGAGVDPETIGELQQIVKTELEFGANTRPPSVAKATNDE